jgi:hypothetical protein
MKNITIILVFLFLLFSACTNNVEMSYNDIPFDTKVAEGLSDMDEDQKVWFLISRFFNGTRDTTFVINGFETSFVIDDEGYLRNINQISVSMDNNLVGAFLLPEAGAVKAASNGKKIIKLFATVDNEAQGIIKNHKYLEVTVEKFNKLAEIFKVKTVNNGCAKIHGFERAVERGITYEQVVKTLAAPEKVAPASYGSYYYYKDEICLIVDQTKKVVTTYKIY